MEFTVHHTSISVDDLPGSLRFYELLGFRLALHWRQPDGAVEIAHLKLAGTFLEIFWYRDRRPAPASSAALETDLPRVGVKHFALRVESIVEARQFVQDLHLAENVEILQGRTGVRYFFLPDPSGILVEVLEDHRGL